jgi:DNA adenine methylase
LFFALQPKRAALTDINQELIDCYLAVRDHVGDLIEALGAHRYNEEHYYEVRDLSPAALPLVARAARTLFLNRTGFNGLYRVNSAGRFNVPFGRYVNPSICKPPELRACAAALRKVDLAVRDFGAVLEHAKAGDFVYFDPPYVPLSSTSSFTSYAAGGFGWKDQERLAELFCELERRGVRAMLSNSDHPEIHRLYDGFQIDRVEALRSINSKATGRGKIGEVVIRSYAKRGRRPARRKAAPSR